MSRGQAARVPSGARDAVVAPSVVGFAVQKIDRLHITRVEERHKGIAHEADVLDIEDEPVRRSLCNAHPVDGFAGKVVNLFQIEHLALLHLIGSEVFAALRRLRSGQGVGVQNQRAPLLVSSRPVGHAREL